MEKLVPYQKKSTFLAPNKKPEYNTEYLPGSQPTIISLDKVNMDNGIASQVVQDIFQHAELMGVHEKISKKKLEGTGIAA